MKPDDRRPLATDSRALQELGLPQPLHEKLRPLHSPALEAHSWLRIAARLEGLAPSPWRLRLLIVVPAFALVVAGALPWLGRAPGVPAAAGLRLAGGESFEGLTATAAVGSVVRFEDGSTLTVQSSELALEPLAMTERDVTLRLASGRVDVHVQKGGRRRWLIEAGEVSVEVVGTRFVVARSAAEVSVAVSEGSVLVRGQKLQDGVARLVAGQRLVLLASGAKPGPLPPAAGEVASLKEAPELNASEPSASEPSASEPSGELSVAPGASGDERRRAAAGEDVATLLRRADRARLAGELPEARRALEAVVKQHPDDPRSALATFQLAVVREQQGESGRELVIAFTQALDRATGASLRQDCYWRLLRAQEQAGLAAEARATAAAALREFPKGRYAPRFRERARLAGHNGAGHNGAGHSGAGHSGAGHSEAGHSEAGQAEAP